MEKDKIVGKQIVLVHIRTTSPIAIGKGKALSEASDSEILKDSLGRPYIPASSLAGALNHWMVQNSKPIDNQYWGTPNDDDPYQSHIIIDNLITIEQTTTERRDGVRIKREFGSAESGAKYDYELAPSGINFYLRMEFTKREGMQDAISSIDQIFCALKDPEFSLGSMSNHGFGQIEVKGFKVLNFKFPEDGQKWLKNLEATKEKNVAEIYNLYISEPEYISLTAPQNSSRFKIVLTGEIKSTLIIGQAGLNKQSDKVSLTSGGKLILSAKSIRGAMRSRAERICKTIGINEFIVHQLFGYTDDEKIKGKLRIQETILENSNTMVHDRIKIDRFTGGTITGALFNSEPLVRNELIIQFELEPTASEAEKGLLLLLIRDIYDSDLAIGGEKNIGRGIIVGKTIEINGDQYHNHRDEIEQWITTFIPKPL